MSNNSKGLFVLSINNINVYKSYYEIIKSNLSIIIL